MPNPQLLIRPFIRREAVLSSRIEGTQADLTDLYVYEAGQLSFVEEKILFRLKEGYGKVFIAVKILFITGELDDLKNQIIPSSEKV